MGVLTWGSYGVAWLVTVAILLLSSHLRRRKFNIPPGPVPWPIIGNFHLLVSLPHRSLLDLSKTYGSFMTVHFGSVPVFVASSVEMAKHFLKTHDAIFANRPKIAAGKYTTYDYSGMSFSPCDTYWRQARKICSVELFSTNRLESYKYIRIEELNSLIRGIFEVHGKKPILLKDHLATLSLNVISPMVLGKSYFNDKESSIVTPAEFKGMVSEWFYLVGVFNLGDWIPWLKWFDVQGYVKRMKILAKKFDRFLEQVLDEHIARRIEEKGNWVPRDMMDILLQVADDPTLEVKLERKGLKAIVQDLLTGGTESMSVMIEWTMTELLRKPEVMLVAMEELDSIVGKERWVQEEDLQNLPYIRAIIKESMRLHPVASLILPHVSTKDVQIKGYDIPKGSVVLVNAFAIQRDPNVYERPEEFLPERFIGKDIDVKGQNFEFLPFGSGRRMCPGYNLGLKVVETSLANLLHGFTWKLPLNMTSKDLDMKEFFGLSTSKVVPLKACAQPRLRHHMYRA